MELTLEVASQEEAMVLFGLGDRNLRLIRDALGVRVTARNGKVRLVGDSPALEAAARILRDMMAMYRDGATLPEHHVEDALAKIRLAATEASTSDDETGDSECHEAPGDAWDRPTGSEGEPTATDLVTHEHEHELELEIGIDVEESPAALEGLVRNLARSRGQARYIQSILKNDIAFCIGPAGTGKTYLAVRMAVNALRAGRMRKIILCRPAVEAGEKLGFLPGDFQAKINPYLRPLYDALNDILDYDQVKRYMEREIIEIIPLAYMRGRTLNHAFIILDEGQNTTVSQMKMFLTRMGTHSKIVVNGDVTQVDLPEGQLSGLVHAERVVKGIEGIGWVELHKPDIVRHPLVKRIVEAYEESERKS